MGDLIAEIARRIPDETQRHVPFMRLVLGWSYFECAIARSQFHGVPLTEAAMRHIAANWTAPAPAGRDDGGADTARL